MSLTGWQMATVVVPPPQFSLYGDGQVIYATEHGTDLVTFDLNRARMTEQQMDDLLSFALEIGGLSDARGRYDNPTATDSPTTVFEIHAGGHDKTVSVYALDAFDFPAPDEADRSRFRLLADRLSAFAGDVSAGTYPDLGPFVPEWYDAFISPAPTGTANARWPWPGLDPEAFERQPDGTLEHVITPEEAQAVAATEMNYLLISRAADGQLYSINITALLPGQLGNF
jgi:hypothetical protein